MQLETYIEMFQKYFVRSSEFPEIVERLLMGIKSIVTGSAIMRFENKKGYSVIT